MSSLTSQVQNYQVTFSTSVAKGYLFFEIFIYTSLLFLEEEKKIPTQ